jgi:hypothetical protein
MDLPACWRALAYVERNPVRAGIVERAETYPCSSTAARLRRNPLPPWLQLAEWSRAWTGAEWLDLLGDQSAGRSIRRQLQEATLGGHPLGEELARRWRRSAGGRWGAASPDGRRKRWTPRSGPQPPHSRLRARMRRGQAEKPAQGILSSFLLASQSRKPGAGDTVPLSPLVQYGMTLSVGASK